jgi:hypothetical protein
MSPPQSGITSLLVRSRNQFQIDSSISTKGQSRSIGVERVTRGNRR